MVFWVRDAREGLPPLPMAGVLGWDVPELVLSARVRAEMKEAMVVRESREQREAMAALRRENEALKARVGGVETKVDGNKIIAVITAENIPSMTHTIEDYLACVSVAQNSIQ